MPKQPTNYSNTIIYKIVCKDLNITDCYVGHTTNFTKRKNQHKCSCINPSNKKYNYNVYEFIRTNGSWENWDMIEIEKYSCKDGNEARTKERYWIENLKASLNQVIPSRTKKEWYQENKEEITEYKNIYNEEHKEQNLKYQKEYYQENKEDKIKKAKEYREQNKEQIAKYGKEYYQENKEYKIKKAKEYREQNKEQIAKNEKEKITCECGSIICKNKKSRHIKSIKHQKYLAEKEV